MNFISELPTPETDLLVPNMKVSPPILLLLVLKSFYLDPAVVVVACGYVENKTSPVILITLTPHGNPNEWLCGNDHCKKVSTVPHSHWISKQFHRPNTVNYCD
jgi:hypothetical protein